MEDLADKVLSMSERVTVLTIDDKNAIETLYVQLLRKPFARRSGCQDCYRDAIIEIKLHLKHKGMTEQKFHLKKGALIYDHQTHAHYTDDNITDEVAVRLLTNDPNLAYQFSTFGDMKPAPTAPKTPAPKVKKPAPTAPKMEPEAETPKDETPE